MNKRALTRSCVCLLVFGLALPMVSNAARKLYRYYNAQGVMVVDYQVPSEYIRGGYEVINDEGDVLEVVPRELTPEERIHADAETKREKDAIIEAERVREWDESLLLRYSTMEDIEAARERALDNLRIRLSILSSNRRSLKQKVENYQAQAAEIERSGGTVGEARLRTTEELQVQIGATERAIVDRQGEIEELSANFQADIDRFAQLQDMVEFRRSAQNQ